MSNEFCARAAVGAVFQGWCANSCDFAGKDYAPLERTVKQRYNQRPRSFPPTQTCENGALASYCK
jgi:hypothetical protein